MSNIDIKKETLARRKQFSIKVYSLKIDNKSLDRHSEYFKRLFLEAKWLYNFLLSQEDIFKINTKDIKFVKVKLRDGSFEERPLQYLSSQMKQSLLDKLKDNIKALSRSKKKGNHIGKLRFKREIFSVILKQVNSTFRIKGSHLFIQGYRKGFHLHGMDQLGNAREIGCARMVKKPSGIYVQVTTYEEKSKIISKGPLGLDFNISNTLTLSNGQQISKIELKESKRLKKLQRVKEKKIKGSINRLKINALIAREYERNSNRKNDIANKIVNKLKDYSLVIQDDNLRSWQSGYFGKSIQHSVLGRIKSRLINLETSVKVIGHFERTTNTCFNCGFKLELKLGDKEFSCPICGHNDFRDLNAAKNILKIGLGQPELTPLELDIDFSSLDGIKVLTLKKEDSIIYVE